MRVGERTFTSRAAEGIPEYAFTWGAVELFEGSTGVYTKPFAVDALTALVHALLGCGHHFTVFARRRCTGGGEGGLTGSYC